MYNLNHLKHIRSELASSRAMLLVFASVFVSLLSTWPQLTAADQSPYIVAQRLRIADTIPGLSSSISSVKLGYTGNVAIKPGDLVPANKLRSLDMASVSWDDSGDSYQYTVMLLDFGMNGTNIVNLFTAINVPGKSLGKGQTIGVYEPPIVPCAPGSKHRLALLVFVQPSTIDLLDIMSLAASAGHASRARRENIKLSEIVTKNRLSLEFANVFQAAGETNGVCSASSSLVPHSFLTLSSITFVMVMLQALLANNNDKRQE